MTILQYISVLTICITILLISAMYFDYKAGR